MYVYLPVVPDADKFPPVYFACMLDTLVRTPLKFIILSYHTTDIIFGKSPLPKETDGAYPVVTLYKGGKEVLAFLFQERKVEI